MLRRYGSAVEYAAGPPSRWSLTHRETGETIEVWADSYHEEDGYFVFSVLVDATLDEQTGLDITGRTPSNPERVIATVARIPATTIQRPHGG